MEDSEEHRKKTNKDQRLVCLHSYHLVSAGVNKQKGRGYKLGSPVIGRMGDRGEKETKTDNASRQGVCQDLLGSENPQSRFSQRSSLFLGQKRQERKENPSYWTR